MTSYHHTVFVMAWASISYFASRILSIRESIIHRVLF